MSRPLGGNKDSPPTATIEQPYLGVTVDYKFAGKNFSPNGSQCSLLLWTYVYDHRESLYERRSYQIVPRKEVKDLIRSRIEDHLKDLGIDPVQRKGIMREWELDNSKCVPYDSDIS